MGCYEFKQFCPVTPARSLVYRKDEKGEIQLGGRSGTRADLQSSDPGLSLLNAEAAQETPFDRNKGPSLNCYLGTFTRGSSVNSELGYSLPRGSLKEGSSATTLY